MDLCPRLDNQSNEPLYLQLYRFFKDEIQSGGIPPLKRLPSIRELAEDLHVSRTTVQTAYQQLLAEGYIESRERSGYFAAEIEKESLKPFFPVPLMESGEPRMPQEKAPIDFYLSGTDTQNFPFSKWKICLNQSLDRKFLSYGDKQGESGLRRALGEYLRQARAVNCTAEQIVMTAGTQMTIRLLCHLIGQGENSIAMEEPGYQGVRHIFQELGFEVIPIPLGDDGIDLDKLDKSGAKVVYVTPSHQYPLGMVMPIAKRSKLLQWAEKCGGLIIEDDYDGEFRYHGKPIPSLQGLDRGGHVIYAGTFSKSLMPGIRMSYFVLPERLLAAGAETLNRFEQTVSRLDQRTLQLFMESGEWHRHIRRMRKIYKKKHDGLLAAIKEVMGRHVGITGHNAGLHIAVQVNSGQNADELVRIAEQAGVKVYSTTGNWMAEQQQGDPIILLGFGGVSEEQIVEGINLLYRAWEPFFHQDD